MKYGQVQLVCTGHLLEFTYDELTLRLPETAR